MYDDDLIPSLPGEEELPPTGNGGHQLTVKTMNANMGAIRVQVERDMRKVRLQIAQMAAYFGDAFEYAIPFKNRKRGTTEIIKGPSIRCTTAVARAYGNCSVDVSAEENPTSYLYEAAFLDIETGFRITRPFRQRRDQNVGGMGGDTGRVEDTVFQIGASKATRNVIRNALPDLVEFALEQARDNLVARITKNRADVENRIVNRLAENGIPLARVEAFYGAKLPGLNPRVLAQIVGQLRAVAEGMMTAAEVCPAGQQAHAPGEPLQERQEGDEREEGETPAQEPEGSQEAQGGAPEALSEPEAEEPKKSKRVKAYTIGAGFKERRIPGLKGAIDELATMISEANTEAELNQLLAHQELFRDMGADKADDLRAVAADRLAALQPPQGGK